VDPFLGAAVDHFFSVVPGAAQLGVDAALLGLGIFNVKIY
jgi:hypothetical protein